MITISVLIPLASSLLGTLLGGALTLANAWRANQQADKRTLKECLYPLLEVHAQLFRASHMRTLVSQLTVTFQQQFPSVAANATDYKQMQALLLNQVLLPQIVQELQQLKENYDASLLKLAGVDPVSAYSLRGRESVILNLQTYAAILIEKLAESSTPVQQAEEAQGIQALCRFAEQAMVRHALVRVEEILLRIAKRLDRRTYREIRQALQEALPTPEQQQAQLQEYMQQIVTLLEQTAQS